MARKVERFEDLIAWQKARQLTAEIYRVGAHGEFSKDFGLRDQIRRAAVSVMSNIVEGFKRGSRGRISLVSRYRKSILCRSSLSTLYCSGCRIH